MTPSSYYKQSTRCMSDGSAERKPKTDYILCKKFSGYCTLMGCIRRHKNLTKGKGGDSVGA